MPSQDVPTKTVLETFFEKFTPGDSLLILAHDHPDPDSISSAAALMEIAKVMGKAKVTIAYGGIIGRAENAHMVKYLKLDLKPLSKVNAESYSYIALVDTQPRTGNNSCPEGRVPDIVIDHHPLISPTKKVPYADVRKGYGATATILSEYLFYFGLEIEKNLATALLYAIKSETQDLGREAFKVDQDYYQRLFPLANKKLIARIVNSRVPRGYFRWLLNAIQHAQMVGNAIVTRLGVVDTPDMIPEIADLMLRKEDTAWALCMGEYQGAVYLSIRTTNPRKNAGNLMKRLVKGKGTGGGHGLIAGARVSAEGLEPWQVHELQNELEEAFLKAIKKNDLPRIPLVELGDKGKMGKSRSLILVK